MAQRRRRHKGVPPVETRRRPAGERCRVWYGPPPSGARSFAASRGGCRGLSAKFLFARAQKIEERRGGGAFKILAGRIAPKSGVRPREPPFPPTSDSQMLPKYCAFFQLFVKIGDFLRFSRFPRLKNPENRPPSRPTRPGKSIDSPPGELINPANPCRTRTFLRISRSRLFYASHAPDFLRISRSRLFTHFTH